MTTTGSRPSVASGPLTQPSLMHFELCEQATTSIRGQTWPALATRVCLLRHPASSRIPHRVANVVLSFPISIHVYGEIEADLLAYFVWFTWRIFSKRAGRCVTMNLSLLHCANHQCLQHCHRLVFDLLLCIPFPKKSRRAGPAELPQWAICATTCRVL